jgi:hypothetical protein
METICISFSNLINFGDEHEYTILFVTKIKPARGGRGHIHNVHIYVCIQVQILDELVGIDYKANKKVKRVSKFSSSRAVSGQYRVIDMSHFSLAWLISKRCDDF